MSWGLHHNPRQSGQATIEFLGALPLMLVLGLALFQLLAVGYAVSLADGAAEAAAIALANGKDPVEAAREALPGWPKKSMQVKQKGERVELTLNPPSPIKQLSKRLSVSAEAVVKQPGAST